MKKCSIFLIGFALLFTGCQGIGTDSIKYTVTFTALPAEGGTVIAKVRGKTTLYNNKIEVPKGTVLDFEAKPHKDYYAAKWTGAGIKSGTDKTKAQLTVTGNTDIKVSFGKLNIENKKFQASCTVQDKDSKEHYLSIVISDSIDTVTVFDLTDNTTYLAASSTFDTTSRTLILILDRDNKPFIQFTNMPQAPADWPITVKGITLKSTSSNKTLTLKDGQNVTLHVDFNDGSYIK